MASPKELVAMVAEQTGVPAATVVQHDRNLSLAGLRTVGGRGLAVARVTYQDAANLLIAVAASRNVKDSVKTVRDYVDLPTMQPMNFGDEVRGRTFGDAVAALLELVPTAPERFSGRDATSHEFVVSISGPALSAKIEWSRPGPVPHKRETTVWSFIDLDGKGPRPVADLTYIAQFTHTTLGHVGTLVAGDA